MSEPYYQDEHVTLYHGDCFAAVPGAGRRDTHDRAGRAAAGGGGGVSEERCDHTDLPVDMCAHCTGRDGAPPPIHDADIVAVFEARYPGRCARCDHDIRPGDHIGRDTDGDYLCGRCLP